MSDKDRTFSISDVDKSLTPVTPSSSFVRVKFWVKIREKYSYKKITTTTTKQRKVQKLFADVVSGKSEQIRVLLERSRTFQRVRMLHH